MKLFVIPTEEIEQDDPELKGKYVFRDDDGEKFMWGPTPVRYEFRPVATLAEADEVVFLCPKCFGKNGGAKGTHSVSVTFTGREVPAEAGSRDADGKPSQWKASGTTIDDLVLSPSILLDAKRDKDKGCHWHGFVGSDGIPPGHAG